LLLLLPLLVLLLLTLWMMLTVPMGLCWLWWPPTRPSWTLLRAWRLSKYTLLLLSTK
jgi:hypothetical protein